MVCLRNISGLLLALAAMPSVLSKPVANDIDARQLSNIVSPILGGDSSSAAGRSGSGSGSETSSASPSAQATSSPTASPSNSPSESPSASPSPTPSNSPSATQTPTTSNSPTQAPTSTPRNQVSTTTPARTSNSPSPTSAVVQSIITDAAGSSSVVYEFVTVVTSNGQQFTATATSVAPVSTGTSDSTKKPADDSGANTGKIVGGVVGGVGGAVLIAALAAVAWRIWGKNRHNHDEDDALMSDGVYGTSEVKASSGPSGASPFQNNLEQYHTPGKTNPSANF